MTVRGPVSLVGVGDIAGLVGGGEVVGVGVVAAVVVLASGGGNAVLPGPSPQPTTRTSRAGTAIDATRETGAP